MKSPRMKRLSIIGFTMIVVIIPFCMYYLFFVQTQNSYFTKRNFRVLADIANQMKSKIDSLTLNLVNAAKRAQEKNENNTGKGQGDAKPVAEADKLKSALQMIPNLQPVKAEPARPASGGASATTQMPTRPVASNARANGADSTRAAVPTSASPNANRESGATAETQSSPSRPAGPASSVPSVSLSLKLKGGSFWLYPEYSGNTVSASASDINKLFNPLVRRYVIDELNETQERLFDEVLVAEQQDGRVIFERGQPGLSIVSLDSLLNDKGGKLELKLADQSSTLADVRFAGADYKLFLQPVRLTLSSGTDDNDQGVRWVVCGLTRVDHFKDETFAISYSVLIVFVFVVLLSVLSWPLLKLRLMGPKDRLRRGDFALTIFSALMGTALLTFFLLDTHAYISLEKTLDDQLEKLSANIQTNFHDELGSVLTQLRSLDEQILASKEPDEAISELKASKVSTPPMLMASPAKAPQPSGKANILAGTIDWEAARYPYFNSVTWADASGLQRIKWATGVDRTALINVSDRAYFSNARDGKTWTLQNADGDFEYYVEPVNSKTTGENVAVISTRVPRSSWVLSMQTRLLSLMRTVLPAGYGYAMIKGDGSVLFHSDEDKNLGEQFFEECGNNRLLRAAVLARVDEFVDAEYLGKGHRLFVRPMPGTPWLLVVFRDKQMARTIHLEMLTLSLILYLVFAVVALLVVSIVYLPRRGERIRRLWPSERNARHYDRLMVINAALVIVFLIVAWKVKSEGLLVFCCFLLPSLATVLGALILKDATAGHGGSDSPVPERLRLLSWLPYRKGYAVALVGSLALMSILPAFGFFQIARNFEMKLMVKHGQVSLARALERRAARTSRQYASITIGPNDEQKNAFLQSRLNPEPQRLNWDVYDSFFFTTLHSIPVVDASLFIPEQPGKLNSLLTLLRPLYNQACVESQELARGGSADGLWSWGQDAQGRFLLQKGKEGGSGEMSLALVSSVPTLGVSDTFSKWLVVILALGGMCALVYQLVRFVTRHFFFLDKDSPRSIVAGVTHLSPTNNVAILRPPMAANGNGWNPENSHRIDLSQVSIWPGWANTIKASVPAAGQTIVLDHFEQDMDDPAANREKLQAIEQFLSESRRVVVVSTVDPLRFSISAASGNPATASNGAGNEASTEPEGKGENKTAAAAAPRKTAASESEQAAARWSMAFSTFVTVYSPDHAGADFVRKNTGFLRVMKANRPWRYLERIGMEIAGNGTSHEGKGLDRAAQEEQINEVVDQARAYHQALWATCSQDERCALIHLALDGMISSKNTDVRQLLKRGLVVRDPGLRLMDESFRRFVLSASAGEDIDAWRHAGGSNWELMKVPLLLILLTVALFLFVTQKEVYDSSVTFLSALTAGLAALFKLLGMFQKKSAGAVDA